MAYIFPDWIWDKCMDAGMTEQETIDECHSYLEERAEYIAACKKHVDEQNALVRAAKVAGELLKV